MPSDTDDPGFDEAVLYAVVRDAVEDAILGAVGTLLLVGVSIALAAIGVAVAGNAESTAGTALGAGVVLVAAYVFAATLGVIPPIREWR